MITREPCPACIVGGVRALNRWGGVRLGDTLGAVEAGAGGCAWPLWPAAGLLIVSPARLRRAPQQRSLACVQQKPCKQRHVHLARIEVGTPGGGSPPSVPSWGRISLRARRVRCCIVAGLRLVAGTSAGLCTGHDVCRAPGSAAR